MASPQTLLNQHFRNSSLGTAFMEAVDTFVVGRRIEPQDAIMLLELFDRIFPEVLASSVRSRLTFKGKLDTYRFCDEVWTFLLKDVTFKMENQVTVTTPKFKIVAMNAKKPGET